MARLYFLSGCGRALGVPCPQGPPKKPKRQKPPRNCQPALPTLSLLSTRDHPSRRGTPGVWEGRVSTGEATRVEATEVETRRSLTFGRGAPDSAASSWPRSAASIPRRTSARCRPIRGAVVTRAYGPGGEIIRWGVASAEETVHCTACSRRTCRWRTTTTQTEPGRPPAGIGNAPAFAARSRWRLPGLRPKAPSGSRVEGQRRSQRQHGLTLPGRNAER